MTGIAEQTTRTDLLFKALASGVRREIVTILAPAPARETTVAAPTRCAPAPSPSGSAWAHRPSRIT